MKLIVKTLIAGLVMSAGVAYAQVAATDPTVIARQDLMKTIGMNTKVLGDMAGGKADFDAAAAEAAKAALIAASADIGAKFETQAEDPGAKAKPEICPSIYAPVSGCDGVTYASACSAAGNGVAIAAAGECAE